MMMMMMRMRMRRMMMMMMMVMVFLFSHSGPWQLLQRLRQRWPRPRLGYHRSWAFF